MKTYIKVSELPNAIAEHLNTWDKEINEAVDSESKKSMAQLVKKTRATAPVGNRQQHYRDSISSKNEKTLRRNTYIWFVKGSDYRLSHLLEDGHALRNGGRVEGTHFIQNATDPIIDAYIKAIEGVLGNG